MFTIMIVHSLQIFFISSETIKQFIHLFSALRKYMNFILLTYPICNEFSFLLHK